RKKRTRVFEFGPLATHRHSGCERFQAIRPTCPEQEKSDKIFGMIAPTERNWLRGGLHAMRLPIGLFLVITLGCGGPGAEQPLDPPAQTEPPAPAEVAGVPDLRTRKAGSDWPGFLGPLGTSVSSEKGIISPWPKEGLRVVWHKRIGLGYAMPSV